MGASAGRRRACVVSGARAEGASLVVRFTPRAGGGEIEDRIPLVEDGTLRGVFGVGRLLRILRAGRVAPGDPSALVGDPERAAELVRRCRGAPVTLVVVDRVERELTLWTDAGVERIRGVIDFEEDRDALWVSRRGAHARLRIPRRSLVRFRSSASTERLVIAVEIPTRSSLRSGAAP
jgi:hypothetical protein